MKIEKQYMQNFEAVIKEYLDKRAEEDEQFAKSYANKKKSITECCKFIMGEIAMQGVLGLTDPEVYGLAVHYYDEKNIKVKPVSAEVFVVAPRVSFKYEPTETEIEEARKKALEELLAKAKDEIHGPRRTKKKAEEETPEADKQPTLFEI